MRVLHYELLYQGLKKAEYMLMMIIPQSGVKPLLMAPRVNLVDYLRNYITDYMILWKDILLWTFEAGLQKHLIHFHRFEYRFFLHQYKFKSPGHFCVFPEWVSCQIRKNCDLCTRRECRERFPRHRPWKKPIVSDPGMHQWCMSRSLTRGGREKIPSITGGCATRNFTFFRNSLLPNHRVRSNIAAVSKGPYG